MFPPCEAGGCAWEAFQSAQGRCVGGGESGRGLANTQLAGFGRCVSPGVAAGAWVLGETLGWGWRETLGWGRPQGAVRHRPGTRAVNGIWNVQTQDFGMDRFHRDLCFSVKFFFFLFLTCFMGKCWGQLQPPGWQKGHHVQKQPSKRWLRAGVFLCRGKSLQKASSVSGIVACSCGALGAPWSSL